MNDILQARNTRGQLLLRKTKKLTIVTLARDGKKKCSKVAESKKPEKEMVARN
jgi:hypothetical protein